MLRIVRAFLEFSLITYCAIRTPLLFAQQSSENVRPQQVAVEANPTLAKFLDRSETLSLEGKQSHGDPIFRRYFDNHIPESHIWENVKLPIHKRMWAIVDSSYGNVPDELDYNEKKRRSELAWIGTTLAMVAEIRAIGSIDDRLFGGKYRLMTRLVPVQETRVVEEVVIRNVSGREVRESTLRPVIVTKERGETYLFELPGFVKLPDPSEKIAARYSLVRIDSNQPVKTVVRSVNENAPKSISTESGAFWLVPGKYVLDFTQGEKIVSQELILDRPFVVIKPQFR